jgi:hypothetical protein
MKKNKKLNKFIPIISILPIISIFWIRDNYNIFTINHLTDNLFIYIIVASIVIYGLNMIYRIIYFSQNYKKLIPSLSFIFVSNIIHQVIFFIAVVPLIQIFGFDFSSNIVVCYLISTIISIIQINNFELIAYNQSSKNSLFSILEQTQKDITLLEIVTILVPIVSILLLAITDISILIDFSPLIGLLIWNIIFTRLIRPQLFTYLKDE